MNKKNIIIGLAGVTIITVVSAATYFIIQSDKQITYQLIRTEKGSVAREIKASGPVKPAESIDMSWEKSGRITSVKVKVGDQVKAGDILMIMDSSDLSAQMSQAQANLLSAQAVLDQLKNGSRPEEIEIKRMELERANQDLDNTYDNAINTLNDTYAKTDEAVRRDTDGMFDMSNSAYPRLTFSTNNSGLETSASTQRALVENDLKKWQAEMASLAGSKNREAINLEIDRAKTYLADARNYLNEAVDLINAATGQSTAATSAYKTGANLGRTYVNGAISAINSQEQAIVNQKLTIARIQKELDLKISGTRDEDLAAQAARVAQAKAAADLIGVQISKTILRAPIAGTITKADAKAGEIALPNVPAVSLISEGKFEIELKLSEADIAHIKTGDTATVKLDAFGDRNYSASIISIDPAESTSADGSSGYKVRLQFSEDYPEMKSGMTANVSIIAEKKDAVLTLPQSLLIRKQEKYFVVTSDKQEKQIEIGLLGSDGKAEVLSGLSEGETVLRLGE